MKTLNLRLVIILGISTVVLSVAVYFVHGWQNQLNAGFYYRQAERSEERAEKAEKEGDLEAERKEKMKAIGQLGWYLNLKPDDVEAGEKLGLLMADMAFSPDTGMVMWNMFSPAWIKLENVVGQEPDRTAARRRLIDLAMRIGRFKDAREHIESLLKVSPKDAELWNLLGRCQQSVREFEEAGKSYRKAIELDRAQLDAYGSLVRLLRYRLRKPDEADALMEKLVEVNAKSAQAHLLHGKYLKEIESHEKALMQTLKGLPLMIREMEGALKQLGMSSAVEKALRDLPKSNLASGEEISKEDVEEVIEGMRGLLEETRPAIGAMETAGKESVPDVALAHVLNEVYRVDERVEQVRKLLDKLRERITQPKVVTKWLDHTLKTAKELGELLDVAPEGLLQAAECASRKIGEDRSRAKRGLGDIVPGIEVTLELSEDGQTVSRIFVDPIKQSSEESSDGETSPEETKPTTITGKAVSADVDANTVTLIRDSDTGKPKKETLAVSPEVEFGSNYAGLARRYVKHGIELFSGNVRMYTALANIELRSGDRDAALKVLEQGLKVTKGNPQLIWPMADLQIDVGDLGDRDAKKGSPEYRRGAWGTIRRLRELRIPPLDRRFPEPQIGYLEARIEFVEHRWAEAARRFESVRGGLVGSSLVLRIDVHLAQCYGRLRNPDRQRGALRKIIAVDPFNVSALDSLARSYIQINQLDDALEVYERMRRHGRIPNSSQLIVLRLLIERQIRQPEPERNWKQIDGMLGSLLDATPQDAPKPSAIVVLQAKSLRAQDREQEAIDLLQQERDKVPEIPVYWITLAEFAMRHDPPKWLEAEQLIDNGDKNVTGYNVALRLARVGYLVSRYGSDAAEQLVALAKEGEEHFAGELAKNEKEIEKIENQLNGLSDDEKQSLKREKTGLEARRSWLESQQLLLLKRLLTAAVSTRNTKLAEKLYASVSTLAPNDVGVRFERFKVALRNKESLDVLRQISKEIGQAEGEGPHALLARAVLMLMSAKKKDDNRLVDALKLVKKIREIRPSWSQPVILAANICERQGKLDAALKHYLTAIEEIGDHSPYAIGPAVRLLTMRNQHDKARELINMLGDRVEYLPARFRRDAGETYARGGDIDPALKLAKQEAAESKDPAAHVWLGQLLATKWQKDKSKLDPMEVAKLLDEAEQSFRKAVELDRKDTTSWIGLVYFFGVAGQAEKAELAMTEAKTQIPADRASLALARCRDLMKQFDKARPLYETAYAASPNDPYVARAVADFLLRVPASSKNALSADKVLQRMIDGKVEGSEGSVRWARLRMATLLGAQRGYEGLKRALKLVEENLAESPSSVSNLRMKSKLLANHPRRAYRQQAIGILKKLTEGKQSQPDDELILAKLYLSEGDWGKASIQFRSLYANLAAKGDYRRKFQIQCVTAYLEAMISHNEFSTARSYIARLQKLAPNAYGTVDMEARLLAQKGEYDKAFDLLVGFLNRPDALPSDPKQRASVLAWRTHRVATGLGRIAGQAEEAGEQSQARRFDMEAERVYHQYVRSEPLNRIVLATFLARRGKIDAAVNEIDSCQSDTHPRSLTHAIDILLRNPKTTSEQIKRLEKIVSAARKRSPESTRLLLLLANLRTREEKYAESEALYREVLKIEPKHVTTMNNLAVVLALQGKKLEEALKLINSAIEIAGPMAPMLDSRATVQMALGKPDKALADLKIAIHEKDTPVRLFHQARAYMQHGRQTRAATASMKKALENGLTSNMLEPLERRHYRSLMRTLKLKHPNA